MKKLAWGYLPKNDKRVFFEYFLSGGDYKMKKTLICGQVKSCSYKECPHSEPHKSCETCEKGVCHYKMMQKKEVSSYMAECIEIKESNKS